MKEMTKEFLMAAFSGESEAHMKYAIFSEDAKMKGKPGLANLFEAISYAEFVHAKNHFKALKKLGAIPENIEQCIEGENFEVEEMYPVYNEVSKFQGEKEAQRSTHYALEAEKIHEDMYRKAKRIAEEEKDYPAKKIFICPVCGHTVEEGVPDKCPICGVPGEKFKEFSV